MRLLKPALLAISGIFIVILAISALLPNHVMTTKWAKIHARKDNILSMVSDLKSWPAWNGLLYNATEIIVSDSVLSWNSGSPQHGILSPSKELLHSVYQRKCRSIIQGPLIPGSASSKKTLLLILFRLYGLL